MKTIGKVMGNRTRPPMMENNQLVNVKIFLSYPKRTKKRKRKKLMVPHQSRSPYDLENIMEDTDDFMPSTSASSTASDAASLSSLSSPSTPASLSSSMQPGKMIEKAGNMDWQNLMGDIDDDTGTLGITEAAEATDPYLNQPGKKRKAANRQALPSLLSGLEDQSALTRTVPPSGFHSDEQLGIPVSASSFSLMQKDISAMTACSFYVILHGQGNLSIRVEVSPDGKNFVMEEEKELHPKQMIVLSPRHVARFARLQVTDQAGGQALPARLDVYFQYRNDDPAAGRNVTL